MRSNDIPEHCKLCGGLYYCLIGRPLDQRWITRDECPRGEGVAASQEETKMDTFQQPKITGYRQLNEQEAALMNEIKQRGVELGDLVAKLRDIRTLDQRWVSIGATDLQTGLMALTRAVAQPTTF